MNTDPSCADLCRDLNHIADWLALDDPDPPHPAVIVLLGNQVIPTLTTACRLAQNQPNALLLFSGGIGHATHLLYRNLASPPYADLFRDGYLTADMGEAELYAVIAQRAFSIPPTRIHLESQSSNGGENARLSLRLLQQESLASDPALLLQDPLMQRRSVLTWKAEAERAGIPTNVHSRAVFVPRVEPGPHSNPASNPASNPDSLPRLIPAHATGTWTFPRYLGLLLGEMARLHDDENGYGPRGKNFLSHIDIPDAVWSAYQRILASPLPALAAR